MRIPFLWSGLVDKSMEGKWVTWLATRSIFKRRIGFTEGPNVLHYHIRLLHHLLCMICHAFHLSDFFSILTVKMADSVGLLIGESLFTNFPHYAFQFLLKLQECHF